MALLHGPQWGQRFAAAYAQAGGALADTAEDRRYWRIRDALACSEEIDAVARPWRAAGRSDLTPDVVRGRLDDYLALLLDQSS